MIEALMLDVDGVLINGRPSDGRHWAATLEADLGLSARALQESFFLAHWEEIVTGRAGLRERLADVLAQVAPTLTAERVVGYWFRQDTRINQRLLRELAILRRGGLRVHLATNQEHERMRFLMNEMGLGAHVDGCHYSAAIGHRKPAPAFFSAAASEAALSTDQLMLIDDDEKNVQAAIEAGWNAARWTGSESLTKILSRQECKMRRISR